MALVGLDHLQLAIPPGGEARARQFWIDLLGLREVPKPPALAVRGGLWLTLPDGRAVHLGVESPFVPAKKAHPALRCDDLDALAARCLAAGHPPRWSDEIPTLRRFHLDDPFGNRVEIVDAGP
ncbi:MAG: VOC family protein [Polyangiales bacterium]